MSQNLKVWEYGGASLPLDLEDADTMERYEDAFERMAQESKDIPKDGRASAQLRAYCGVFRRLFDRILGEGAALQILGESDHPAACEAAYESFLAFVQAQSAASAQQRMAFVAKYRPNRAQKRAASRKK